MGCGRDEFPSYNFIKKQALLPATSKENHAGRAAGANKMFYQYRHLLKMV
jgi:hypothetical protein